MPSAKHPHRLPMEKCLTSCDDGHWQVLARPPNAAAVSGGAKWADLLGETVDTRVLRWGIAHLHCWRPIFFAWRGAAGWRGFWWWRDGSRGELWLLRPKLLGKRD
jgi:hypothetical protein